MVSGENGKGNDDNCEINLIILSDSWSDCSRTCGGGIRKSVRDCDTPTPTNGGLYCTGDRLRYKSCKTEDCHNAADFRLEQCKAYNGNNFKIADLPSWVQWVPKYSESRFQILRSFLIFYFKLKTSASFIAVLSTPVHTTFWIAPLRMGLPVELIPLTCVLVGNVYLRVVIIS